MKVEGAFKHLKQQGETALPFDMIDKKNRRWQICTEVKSTWSNVGLDTPLEELKEDCCYKIESDGKVLYMVYTGLDDGTAYRLFQQELAKRKQSVKDA
jgi:hypothetical protein